MSSDVAITVHVRDLTGPGAASVTRSIHSIERSAESARGPLGRLSGEFDGLSDSASGAANALGKGGSGGSGLTTVLWGVAGVLGTAAAPALGALVPILAGVGVAGGAVALSLKDIKKEAKDLKPAFKDLQEVASKSVMPGVKDAVKDLKVALKELHPTVKIAGKSVGEFARDAGRFAKSPAFQGALLKNVQMGSRWFNDFGDSVFKLTQSLLDFGTKSQPTLDALGGGLNDLIGSGLPGFFRALEPGIAGSAEMFKGLFEAVDKLLVSLGGFSASFAKNLGPLLGEVLRYVGDLGSSILDGLSPALDALKPLADSVGRALESMGLATDPLGKGFGTILAGAIKLVTPVLQNWFDLAAIAIPVIKDLAKAIIGPLVSAFAEVTGVDDGLDNLGGGIKDFGSWVHDHRAGIEAAFRSFAVAVLDFVITTVDGAPSVFNAFRQIGEAALEMAGVVVQGIAIALAPVPGLGDKAWQALGDFNRFRDGVHSSFDDIGGKIEDFRANALPKLKGARLELETSSFDRGLAASGRALAGAKLDKKGSLTAEDKTRPSVASAQRNINRLLGKAVNLIANNKVSPVVAAAQAAINSLYGANVAIGVAHRATGGIISGPGSGTSDDVPAMLSNGEFVVNAQATKRNRGLLEAINSGTVQHFAKGGISDSMRQARKEATGLLTISYFGQRAGYKNSEFANSLGKPDTLGDLVSSLNKWRSLIKAATSGGTESRLLKSLNSTASTLIKQEKALTKVNAALDKAKDKLSSLKDAAAQLKSQVTSSIVGSGNITGMASQGGLVTLGGIKSGLAGKASEAAEFAAALNELRKRGLNGQSISEIAQAGLEGGGLATARTLLGASSADIKEINSLEEQLKKSATAAGKATSDAFYGAGIKAAEGLVKGLQKQQDKIEAVMAKAAKALEKAIEKALGIKGKASGGIIGAASGGPRAGWTLVGEQGPELARLPYGSTVYPAGATRQMLAGGGGGGQVIQVNLVLDGKVVARQLIDPLSGEIRRINGGDVQGALGKGKVRT